MKQKVEIAEFPLENRSLRGIWQRAGDMQLGLSPDDVNLRAVFYAAVGPSMPEKDFAWNAPDMKTLPDGGKRRFGEYFCHLYNTLGKTATRYTAQAHEEKHHNYRLEEFNDLLQNPSKKDNFEKKCEELTRIFQEIVHPSAPDGILFLMVFELEDKSYLCILKLETASEGILYVVENLVKYDDFEEALPRAKDMQKGAIYPHPAGPKKAFKVLQEDGYADYFDSFLGAYRAKPTSETVRFLLDSVDPVRGEGITFEETMAVMDSLLELVKTETKVLSDSELTELLMSSVAFADKAAAEKKLRERAIKKGIKAGELVKNKVENLKIKLDVGNIRIQGTRKAIKEQLKYSRTDDAITVTVEGSTFSSTVGSY